MTEEHPGGDAVLSQVAAKQERERLMDLLDAESIREQGAA